MPANFLPIANYENPFQLGELPSNKIPVDVWLQIQPGDFDHDPKTTAICEQRRIDFITIEKEKKLKRFQRAVKRRLQKRARQKAKAQTLENLRLIPSEISTSPMSENCDEADSIKSTAIHYSLPDEWTPHQPHKLREARVREKAIQSHSFPALKGMAVGEEKFVNRYPTFCPPYQVETNVKVTADVQQQQSRTKHVHINEHPLYGNNMLQTANQNPTLPPSITTLCRAVSEMDLEGDEDLEYVCDERQFLRRAAKGRMAEKVRRRTNAF